jgi:hypothetical protein|tara:strand:+ start:662 stop:841 length:180 start_codon:yes stop_codon:yes gene_type:complete
MVSITKKTIPKHQWKFRKKYGIKRKVFYRVKNVAGETLNDFPTKLKALKYKRKLKARKK